VVLLSGRRRVAFYAGGSSEAKGPKKISSAVTIEDFNDVLHALLLDQLKDEAEKSGAEVIAADGKRDPNEQIKQIENFITQGVRHFIHVIDQTLAPRVTKLCTDAKIPLVYVNRKPETRPLKAQRSWLSLLRRGRRPSRSRVRRKKDRRKGQCRHPALHPRIGASARQDEGQQGRLREYPESRSSANRTANFQRPDAVTVRRKLARQRDKIDAIVRTTTKWRSAPSSFRREEMNGQSRRDRVDATSDA
jgi:inositol transport system substrate-binding protein